VCYLVAGGGGRRQAAARLEVEEQGWVSGPRGPNDAAGLGELLGRPRNKENENLLEKIWVGRVAAGPKAELLLGRRERVSRKMEEKKSAATSVWAKFKDLKNWDVR
jgi:hypothetical protein